MMVTPPCSRMVLGARLLDDEEVDDAVGLDGAEGVDGLVRGVPDADLVAGAQSHLETGHLVQAEGALEVSKTSLLHQLFGLLLEVLLPDGLLQLLQLGAPLALLVELTAEVVELDSDLDGEGDAHVLHVLASVVPLCLRVDAELLLMSGLDQVRLCPATDTLGTPDGPLAPGDDGEGGLLQDDGLIRLEDLGDLLHHIGKVQLAGQLPVGVDVPVEARVGGRDQARVLRAAVVQEGLDGMRADGQEVRQLVLRVPSRQLAHQPDPEALLGHPVPEVLLRKRHPAVEVGGVEALDLVGWLVRWLLLLRRLVGRSRLVGEALTLGRRLPRAPQLPLRLGLGGQVQGLLLRWVRVVEGDPAGRLHGASRT